MIDFSFLINRKWLCYIPSFVITFLLLAKPMKSQKVLYMLQERNTNVTISEFSGDTFSIIKLFDGSILKGSDPILHYGGVLLRRVDDDIAGDHDSVMEYLTESIDGRDLLFNKLYTYEHIRCFDLSNPNRPPYQIEVGLYDKKKRIFESREWRDATIGHLVAIIAQSSSKEFKFLVNVDSSGRRSVMLQTWKELNPSSPSNFKPQSQALNIATYNLWNTNPHSWAVADPSQRLRRYSDRLALFAEVLIKEDADIVLLQEVRLDNSFRTTATDGGNQMSHLLAHLRGGVRESEGDRGRGQTQQHNWEHFYFQPAMSMFDKNNPRVRVDEGLGIISKYPLDVDALQILLLPRMLTDQSDDHSRIVLRSLVQVSENIRIDTMTSHWSLSAASREAAVKMVHETLGESGGNYFQVFAGDLNAEPTELAIKNMQEAHLGNNAFVDAWSSLHSDYRLGTGFTFPACRPVKRIDYIFARNSSGDASLCGYMKRVKIIGTRAREEIELNLPIELAPEVGMLDEESLLWASDHFGLLLTLELSEAGLCIRSTDMANDEL